MRATQLQIAGQGQQQVPHPQLQEATFTPVTPLKADQLEYLLQGYPNCDLVNYVLQGIRQGTKDHTLGDNPGICHQLTSSQIYLAE